MFVLLEHSIGGQIHWDFIIEAGETDLLPTWRLLSNPLNNPGPIRAERIADHRPAFLDYEGPLSEGRGSVKRLDRGEAEIVRFDESGLRAHLHGRLLHADTELLPRGHAWLWRCIGAPDQS